MSPERSFDSKMVINRAVLASAVIAVSSAGALAVREISRRREQRLQLESIEQSAGDGNYVVTPKEVMSRSQLR